ncbi:MAG: hypothetical protein IAE81_16575 [Caldilineaceae bacterium]|nr:hypothetical protein [Caldilineaceae bacterium]
MGVQTPSAAYLATYCEFNRNIPPISLDCVMKAAGLIENMGSEPLPPRKAKEA